MRRWLLSVGGVERVGRLLFGSCWMGGWHGCLQIWMLARVENGRLKYSLEAVLLYISSPTLTRLVYSQLRQKRIVKHIRFRVHRPCPILGYIPPTHLQKYHFISTK